MSRNNLQGLPDITQEEIVKLNTPVIDSDWVNSRFMVPDENLTELDAINRYRSSADNKFQDTRLGGTIGINAKPQYTRTCDIRSRFNRMGYPRVTIPNTSGNFGMGKYYSKAIDDNAQTIFFEFGIPKFNSLFDFFSKSVNYVDSVVANTGRSPAGYYLGKLYGGLVIFTAFPLASIAIWFAKAVIGLLTGHGAFNYYYLDATMHSYWGTVNTIVNQMVTEEGILIPEFTEDGTQANKIGSVYKVNQADLDEMKKMIPGIIGDNNYIDVFAIATRAQAVANRQILRDRELFVSGKEFTDDYVGYVKTANSISEKDSIGAGTGNKFNALFSFRDYLDKTVRGKDALFSTPVKENEGNLSEAAKAKAKAAAEAKAGNTTAKATKDKKFEKNKDGTYTTTPIDETYAEKFFSAVDSGVRDGGAYAAFQVDYVTGGTTSFSNSVNDIGTEGALKSLSKKSRDVKFSMSGGNILGDTVSTAAGYVKDVVAGALDSVTFGASNVLQTLLGGGYIDIPKKWDDSTASFPSITYTMKLVSPYDNPISRLQNILIPMAMLMGGMLPKSVGRASYASPYICSLHNRGVQQVDLGMITELSLTAGVTNLAYDGNWKALSYDVSFTVTDFSKIMAAPVNSSIFNLFSTAIEDDTPIGRYIATMAGRSLLANKYAVPKAKLRASRLLMGVEQAISPSSLGLRVGNSLNSILGFTATGTSLIKA